MKTKSAKREYSSPILEVVVIETEQALCLSSQSAYLMMLMSEYDRDVYDDEDLYDF